MTKKNTLTSLALFKEEVKKSDLAPKYEKNILVFATKTDLPNRVVSYEDAVNTAKELGMSYFKGSSKTGDGITLALDALVQSMATYKDEFYEYWMQTWDRDLIISKITSKNKSLLGLIHIEETPPISLIAAFQKAIFIYDQKERETPDPLRITLIRRVKDEIRQHESGVTTKSTFVSQMYQHQLNLQNHHNSQGFFTKYFTSCNLVTQLDKAFSVCLDLGFLTTDELLDCSKSTEFTQRVLKR